MPELNQPSDDIAGRARRLLESDAAPAPAGDDARALAWALKDLCYEAWSSEPARSERAAQALRALLDAGVPPAQAVEVGALADWTEGIAHLTRGRMADALRCFDQAGAGLRAAGQPDPAAQTQVPKIMALSMLGRHDEAAECAQSAQRELLALGNVRAASRVSLNLGALQLRRDAYRESARHYREASVLFARVGDRLQSVIADAGLADALAALGDLDEAMRIYARARMRADGPAFELPLAQIDESAALVDLARGHWREALAGFESACRRYAALGMPQYHAIAEKQLGDAYLELRLLPEALRTFDAVLARCRELAMPDEEAWALAQRGRAQALLGRAAEAGGSFAAAAALFAAQGNGVGTASVALARAELAVAEGAAGPALAHAAAAVAGFDAAGQAAGALRAELVRAQALLGAGRVGEARAAFDAALALAQQRRLLSEQVRAVTGQGRVALAEGRTADARAAFDGAIAMFEEQRRTLPGDDLRRAFLADHLRPYEERLRITLADGRPDEVLAQLDRFRARALDEWLGESGAAADDAAAADDDTRGLRERLDWLYRRIQRLQVDGDDAAVPAEEARRVEHELLERARRRRLAAPRTTERADAGFDPGALCAALADGDALVEYGVLGDELFACVATRDGVTLQRGLASWSATAEAVRALRFQLETLRHGAAPVQQHLAMLARRAGVRLTALHALVWAPLEPALGAARRVLVVPHAQLGALPFAALGDATGGLADRYDIAVVPSARLALRGLSRPIIKPQCVLAFANTERLPAAGPEAAAVVALYPAGRVLSGPQAGADALRDGAPEADVLHLACHAQFRADNPSFSALHLPGGALTAERVEGLRLRAATVVLSACETGLADTDTGDERVGLVRAFLVAGAARVLASLWPVDDAVTAAFMVAFHTRLSAGDGPAVALRNAQRAVRAEHPHPYFWAAFTLYGGW